MSNLTLGSLFDGSGGFPLGAFLTGIEPLWASEVEPFPIRVTTKRFPNMKHYGDINKIDGSLIPPVDIITAGFCCQDLSVAGKRAGLQGERSGLFYQIPRIIKEMLAATNNQYKFPQQQQVEEGKAVVERVAVENYQHSGYRESDTAGTLKQSGGTNGGGSESVIVENRYVVRRLTPTECALLQGFPPDWCAGLETTEPSEEDISFWSEVWETDRLIKGTSSKPKSRKQIIKWLQYPHSDSAEYKMWGNGVALPCVTFVLSGIVSYTQR